MTAAPVESGTAPLVRVYQTVDGQVRGLLVTPAVADQMELDFIRDHGIQLPAEGVGAAGTSGSNPQPSWPAVGTFTVRETGFYSVGARCPAGSVDAPPQAVAAYNQARGTSATDLDLWETSISESWEKVNADGTRSMYGSSMVHQPADGSPSTTYRYGRDAPVTQEGWTLQYAFEGSIAPGSSFFCREENPSSGGVDRVRLTAVFFPVGDRVDD